MHLNIAEWGYGFVPEVFRQFFADTWMHLVLFSMALIVIWWLGDKRAKWVLVYPMIIFALTIYNPWLMRYVIEIIGLEARYYRYLWMIPVALEISYAAILLGNRWKKWYIKAGAVVMLVTALVLGGNSTMENMTEPENLYKVRTEVVDISQTIRADSEKEENTCLYMDTDLLALRSLDPSIQAVFTRRQYMKWSVDITNEEKVQRIIRKKPASYTLALVMRYGYQVEQSVFQECISECEVDYIIPLNALGIDEYLKDMGYVQIYNNGHHSVYRVDGEE